MDDAFSKAKGFMPVFTFLKILLKVGDAFQAAWKQVRYVITCLYKFFWTCQSDMVFTNSVKRKLWSLAVYNSDKKQQLVRLLKGGNFWKCSIYVCNYPSIENW